TTTGSAPAPGSTRTAASRSKPDPSLKGTEKGAGCAACPFLIGDPSPFPSPHPLRGYPGKGPGVRSLGRSFPPHARCSSNFDRIACLGNAPSIWSTTCPPLKMSSVGTLITWYLTASSCASSVLHLTTFTRPSSSRESSSTMGATRRQGPHHGAQKS